MNLSPLVQIRGSLNCSKPGQCRQPAFNPVNSVNIPCKFRQNVQVKITEEELSLAKHVKAQWTELSKVMLWSLHLIVCLSLKWD